MEIYSFDKVKSVAKCKHSRNDKIRYVSLFELNYKYIKLVANVEKHIFELDNPKSKEYNDYDDLPF